MSDADPDPKVSERYQALGGEAPPRALDDAILAAAHREVEARPAPLVAPTGRRRWYVPLAAAAVIVLSVAVSFHMQLEEPGMDGGLTGERRAAPQPAPHAARAPEEVAKQTPSPKAEVAIAELRTAPEQIARAPEQAAARAPAPSAAVAEAEKGMQGAAAEPRVFARDPAPRTEAEEVQAKVQPLAKAEEAPASAPAPAAAAKGTAAAAPAAKPAPAAPDMRRDEVLLRERTDRVAAQQMRARLAADPEPPEKALERIAELRRAGRHEEADKALAEFRKRYPDYKIPEAMLERVERR